MSAATVSRAFNHPDLVKPTTRRRVERAVERLGYIRNRAAQTIHGQRSGTLGLIAPTMTNSIFSEVTQAFSDAVDEAGFVVLMATHGYDLTREVRLLRKFLEHRVDGVALIGLDHDEATFTLLDRHAVPALAMWSYAPDSRLSCVGADNAEAGAAAARHLVSLGHRRVGLVMAPTIGNERARNRLEGATAVLNEAGASISDAWRMEAEYDIAVAKRRILELFRGSDRPSALLCGNDTLATGALFAAAQAGLSAPDDISIVGIGDFPGSADLEPGLTTVRLPARSIGERAGKRLLESIREGGNGAVTREKCDVELRVRGSTRAL